MDALDKGRTTANMFANQYFHLLKVANDLDYAHIWSSNGKLDDKKVGIIDSQQSGAGKRKVSDVDESQEAGGGRRKHKRRKRAR